MTSIQDSGLFPSRKRRSGDIVDGLKQEENKRSFRAGGKNRDASGSSSSSTALPSLGVVAGAVAPKFTNNNHVQEAIHKEVQYSREGKGKDEDKVPETTLAVFRFVKEAFVVPNDFEKDHKFGPLSGVSHEVRVVSAYMAGQLEARTEEAKRGVKMCLEAIMSLPLATFKELRKLSELKAKGVILERQYEVIKKNMTEGNSVTNDNWEALDVAWELKSAGVFSEEGWTTQTMTASKDYLSKHCNTLAWYFPANTTDELQPVDAGAGRMLKVEAGKLQDAWLEPADNVESGQVEELSLVDGDDSMGEDDEVQGMDME
eukprot:g17398.t1